MSHRSDGSHFSTAYTDADGSVVVQAPRLGMVTAAASPYFFDDDSTSRGLVLSTIAGVENGDDLTIGTLGGRIRMSGSPPRTYTVALEPTPGAVGYEVISSCGECRAVDSILQFGCYGLSLLGSDVVAYAVDAEGSRFAWSSGVFSSSVPLSLPPFEHGTNPSTLALLPPAVGAEYDARLIMRKGDLWDDERFTGRIETGQALQVRESYAPGYYDDDALVIVERTGPSHTGSRLVWSTPTIDDSVAVEVDLSGDLLPQVSDLAFTAGETFTVRFVTPGPLTCAAGSADALLMKVSGRTPGVADRSWHFLLPADSTLPFTAPRLDPALQDSLWPGSSMTSFVGRAYYFADDTVDYHAMRNSEWAMSPDMLGSSRRCVSDAVTDGYYAN